MKTNFQYYFAAVIILTFTSQINGQQQYDIRKLYQPVSIEMRNNVPRVIRDEGVHK